MTAPGTTASDETDDGAATADTMPDGRAPTPEYPGTGADGAQEPGALSNAAASKTMRPNGAPMPMRREPTDLTMMERQATTHPVITKLGLSILTHVGNPSLS